MKTLKDLLNAFNETFEDTLCRQFREALSRNEYDLVLMSELPENKKNLAKTGKIYLSEETGAYVVRDPQGKVRYGLLGEGTDLNKLADRLSNPAFKDNILDVISKTDGTHRDDLVENRELRVAFYEQRGAKLNSIVNGLLTDGEKCKEVPQKLAQKISDIVINPTLNDMDIAIALYLIRHLTPVELEVFFERNYGKKFIAVKEQMIYLNDLLQVDEASKQELKSMLSGISSPSAKVIDNFREVISSVISRASLQIVLPTFRLQKNKSREERFVFASRYLGTVYNDIKEKLGVYDNLCPITQENILKDTNPVMAITYPDDPNRDEIMIAYYQDENAFKQGWGVNNSCPLTRNEHFKFVSLSEAYELRKEVYNEIMFDKDKVGNTYPFLYEGNLNSMPDHSFPSRMCEKFGLCETRYDESRFIEALSSNRRRFVKINLNRANLENRDLTKLIIRNSALSDVNFSKASLENARFIETELSNVDFSNSILKGAVIAGATLRGGKFIASNLEGAELKFSTFDGTNLSGAILENADLSAAKFRRGTSLENANLKGASLTHSVFDGVNLSGAILEDTDLCATTFLKGTNLKGANLKGANLRRVNLCNVQLLGANLQNAKLTGATLTVEQVHQLSAQGHNNFKNIIIQGTDTYEAISKIHQGNQGLLDLKKIDIQGATLANCNLSHADFTAVDVSDCVFLTTNLSHANFEDKDLRQVKFGFSNLKNANLKSADLRGVDLREVQLRGADLQDAQLSGTILTIEQVRQLSAEGHNNFEGVIIKGSTSASKYEITEEEAKTINFQGTDISQGAKLPENIDLNGVRISGEQLGILIAGGRRAFKGVILKDTCLCGVDLSGCNFTGASLIDTLLETRGDNFSNMNFDGAYLQNVTFNKYGSAEAVGNVVQDTSFERAILDNVHFSRAKFMVGTVKNCNFSGTSFNGNTLTARRLDFSNCDFTDARVTNAEALQKLYKSRDGSLQGMDLEEIRLSRKSLSEADFSNANLENAEMASMELKNTRFQKANIRNVEFSGSNLTGADFRNAVIEGANLSNANIGSANFSNLDLRKVNLQGVHYCEAEPIITYDSSLVSVNALRFAINKFDKLSVKVSNKFIRQEPILSGCQIGSEQFLHLYHCGVRNFSGVHLRDADLQHINLDGVNFNNAILSNIDLKGAEIKNSSFDGTRFNGTNFNNTTVKNTTFKGEKGNILIYNFTSFDEENAIKFLDGFVNSYKPSSSFSFFKDPILADLKSKQTVTEKLLYIKGRETEPLISQAIKEAKIKASSSEQQDHCLQRS